MTSNINVTLKHGDIPQPMKLGNTRHKKEASPGKTIDIPVCIINPLHEWFE